MKFAINLEKILVGREDFDELDNTNAVHVFEQDELCLKGENGRIIERKIAVYDDYYMKKGKLYRELKFVLV